MPTYIDYVCVYVVDRLPTQLVLRLAGWLCKWWDGLKVGLSNYCMYVVVTTQTNLQPVC